MPSASFRFGPNSEHEVEVQCGHFGNEKYFVDGLLVCSHWSLRPSGVRQFNALGHSIQVRVSVNMKGVRAEALVDGKVVAEDLFAEFNARLAKRSGGPPWLVKVAVWFAVALVVFIGLKLIEQRPAPSVGGTTTGKPAAAAHV